jgi:hypothetical protein
MNLSALAMNGSALAMNGSAFELNVSALAAIRNPFDRNARALAGPVRNFV